MELTLYIKEGEELKALKVPQYVVKDLLRDRLSQSELDRINRFADKVNHPLVFKAGSVVVDFQTKEARCFQSGLNVADLEPTWRVEVEKMQLENY